MQDYFKIFIAFSLFSYQSLIARSLELIADFGSAYLLCLIDKNSLLAAGLITALQNFIVRTSRLSLFGTPTLLKETQSLAQEAEKLHESQNFAILLSILIIIIYCSSGSILNALGQNPNVAHIVQHYSKGYSWGLPAILMQVSQQQFLYFKKAPWLVCLFNFLQTVLTLSLGYIFIFILKWDALGLGLATSIAAWMIFFITHIFLIYYYNKAFRFKLINNIKRLKSIINLGLPIAIQLGSELFTLTMTIQMCGLIGDYALAAAGIALQWINYIIIPMQTLSQAANILISQRLQQQNFSEAQKIGTISPFILAIFPLFSVIIFIIFGNHLANLFIHAHHFYDQHEQILIGHTAYILMIIITATLIIDAIRTGLGGSLRGYGYTKIPGLTGFINLGIIALILSYLFGLVFTQNATIAFAVRAIPTMIDSLILIFLWRWVSKRELIHS